MDYNVTSVYDTVVYDKPLFYIINQYICMINQYIA